MFLKKCFFVAKDCNNFYMIYDCEKRECKTMFVRFVAKASGTDQMKWNILCLSITRE